MPTQITHPQNRLERAAVVAILRDHRADLRAHGVASLRLFGSVARDEAVPESDIDFLVRFQHPVTSDTFFGLKFFLEDLFNRPIDLVTEGSLGESIRAAVESESLVVT